MTNLLTTSRQPWLTRGRLLVGFPLGLGGVVSAAVVAMAVLPVAQATRELEQRRDELLSLQRSLTALERQLSQAETELKIAEDQQALLVGLLAGRDKVQTFLALLNQKAVASGVQMLRYEPLKMQPPQQAQSRQNNRRSNANQKAESPQDPLQVLGYRKSSVALGLSGSFAGLQTFLQHMEALELLVASSDLSLQASAVGQKDGEAPPKQADTKLTLRLSFYDLATQPADRSTAGGLSDDSA